jgi:hypothetical protein
VGANQVETAVKKVHAHVTAVHQEPLDAPVKVRERRRPLSPIRKHLSSICRTTTVRVEHQLEKVR